MHTQTIANNNSCLIEDPVDRDSVAGVRGRLVTSKSVIQMYGDIRKLVTYWVILSPHFDIAMTLEHTASDNSAPARSFEGLQGFSFFFKKK